MTMHIHVALMPLLALIAGGPPELYPLLGLLGGVAGYLGFRWLRHLPL